MVTGSVMGKPKLENIVDQIVDLPTLPQVVMTIMGLLEDPKSCVSDINNIMARDPALAAKILKLVNSAFYALPNRVNSISQAIVILGFNTVKSLAISASILDMFGQGDEFFSYEDFWTHSVGVGTIASALARRYPEVDEDSAFVVGLMHDLGKLVLDQYAPTEFQEILHIARENKLSFHAAEIQVLGTSHDEIGYWLAQKWQLDPSIAQAIRFHHDVDKPEEEKPRMLATLCSFANYVCKMKQYGNSGCFDAPAVPKAAWQQMRISRDALPGVIASINEEMNRATAFLSMVNT